MRDIFLPAAQLFVIAIENILRGDVGNLTRQFRLMFDIGDETGVQTCVIPEHGQGACGRRMGGTRANGAFAGIETSLRPTRVFVRVTRPAGENVDQRSLALVKVFLLHACSCTSLCSTDLWIGCFFL